MNEYSSRVIAAWLECFPEKPNWCRNEQVCKVYSALILRYKYIYLLVLYLCTVYLV